MALVILHLSDIHIKTAGESILDRGQTVASCIFDRLPTAVAVAIVVSGDIAFSGEPEQYKLATSFLRSIKCAIETEKQLPVYFVTAPGNHDCNFENDSASRRALLSTLSASQVPEIDQSVIENCTVVQASFMKFRDELEVGQKMTDDKLWRTIAINVNDRSVAFDSLNLSWTSQKRESVGHLYFPIDRYESKSEEVVDLRIAVIHHPHNWVSQNVYRAFRSGVRKLADVIFSGHEHQANFGQTAETESGISTHLEAAALQKHDSDDSGFSVVTINVDSRELDATKYEWNGLMYCPANNSRWSTMLTVATDRLNRFPLHAAFQERLEDPGAFFTYHGKDISLSDIYVHPDLKEVACEGDQPPKVSSRQLLKVELIRGGVLIEGESNAGRTSLCYQLYKNYHGNGLVPILLEGSELRSPHDIDIDALIRKAFRKQYGENQYIQYTQLPRERKVLIVDDFDDCVVKASISKRKILRAFADRFSHFVVSVGAMFEMRELLDEDDDRLSVRLRHFKIEQFGHVLRSDLIERWFNLSFDGSADDAEQIAQHDRAERLMNSVMSRSVIPYVPFYLLTLLQSLEVGRSGEFSDSALGHYYHYLLTKGMSEAGVKQDKLTEVFQYCTQLAWYFHGTNKSDLTHADLEEFNDGFCNRWHKVDLIKRINTLLDARILIQAGTDYAFRYPYAYYYFKALYLSENLPDLETRAYIEHCCSHLYVRDHAYTVLFLAHHSNDELLLTSMSDALTRLFSTKAPISFSPSDLATISKLVEDAPRLTYRIGSPQEHRRERNSLNDELDDNGDGLTESEEHDPKLSLSAQLTALIKTTEILGQILKNQYSKIERTRKKQLLLELFNAPLRSLADFYELFDRHPDALLSDVERAFAAKELGDKDTEKKKKTARQAVAMVIEGVSISLLGTAIESASSEDLHDDIRSVTKESGSIAHQLIEIGVLLDSPRAIPRVKLLAITRVVSNNVVAMRLLKMLVLRRLYMFKTTEHDMQWLSTGQLQLDMAFQRALSVTAKGTRLNN